MANFTKKDQEVLEKLKKTEDFWQKHGGYKELEVVPFSDENKLKFHYYMRDLAQKLLGDGINLEDENLVFMLSENKQPNAAFVHEKTGEHNFIYVSTGLFDLCENKDQFAFVLGHELQHFLEDKKHRDKINTKLEETYADLNAVPKLARAGLNIRQAGVIANKIFTNEIVNLAGVIDAHGLDVNRVKSIDMTILATKTYLGKKGLATPDIVGEVTHPYEEDFMRLLSNRPRQESLRDFFESEKYLKASYDEKVVMWFDKVEAALYLTDGEEGQVYAIDELDKKILREERLKLHQEIKNRMFHSDYEYMFESMYLDRIYKEINSPELLESKGHIFNGLSEVPELGRAVGRFEFDYMKDFLQPYFKGFREAKDVNEAKFYVAKLFVLKNASPEHFFGQFINNGNLFELDHDQSDVGKTISKSVLYGTKRWNPVYGMFDIRRLNNGDIILHEGGVYFGIDENGKINLVERNIDAMDAKFIAEQINDIVHSLYDIRNGKETNHEIKLWTLARAWRLCMPARAVNINQYGEDVYVSKYYMNFINLERLADDGGMNISLVEKYLSDEAKEFWMEKESYPNEPENSWFKYITDTLDEEIRKTKENERIVTRDVDELLWDFKDSYVVALRTDECEQLLKAKLETSSKSDFSSSLRSVADMQLLHHLEKEKSIDDFRFPFEDICKRRLETAKTTGEVSGRPLSVYYSYEMLKEDPEIDLSQIYAKDKKELDDTFGAEFSLLPLIGLPPAWKVNNARSERYEYPNYCAEILNRYRQNINDPKNWGDGTVAPGAMDMPFAERFYYLIKNLKQGYHTDGLKPSCYADIALHFYQKATIEDKIEFMVPALGYTLSGNLQEYSRNMFWEVICKDFENKDYSLKQRMDLFFALNKNNVFSEDYIDYFDVLVGMDGKGGLLKEIAEAPAPKADLYLEFLKQENRIVDPEIRRQVVSLFCQSWHAEHGSYNDITATPEQRAKFIKDVAEIKETIKGKSPIDENSASHDEFFEEFLGKSREGRVPENDARQFLSELAELSLSQLEVCRAIEPDPKEINTQDKEMIAAAYGIDGLTYLLEQGVLDRNQTIDFFLGDGSRQEAVEFSANVRNSIRRNSYKLQWSDKVIADYEARISPEAVMMMKKEFDAAPLEIKAALINMLTSGNDWEKNFDQVAGKLFADSGELGEIGKKFLKSYIASRDENERCFYLSAIYTAANSKSAISFDDKSSPYTPEQRSLAQGLRLFLENSGPAGVKLAQAMSSYKDVPEFIRDEMQKAKNNANPPDRWMVFDWLEDAGQMNLLKLGKLGKRIGSASFFVTYTMLGEDGKKLVTKILRGGSKFTADEEFKVYKKMLKSMQKDFAWLSSFGRLVDNAASMVDVETDLKIGKEQLEHAKALYPDKAKGDDKEFNIKVMDWTGHDKIWAVMQRADGKDFADLHQPYKKAAAKAIFVTELANMLSGKRFDSDRHAGQYKIDEKTNTIGVFDTGSISVVEPTNKEKEVLGVVLANVTKALMNGNDSDVAVVLCDEIDKGIEKHYAEEIKSGKSVPPYLSEFQRGLLALTDFHKEIPPKELAVCLMQALNNGKQKLDPVIYKGFASAMFDDKADKQLISGDNAAEIVTSLLTGEDKTSVMTEEAKTAQNFGKMTVVAIIENGDIYGAITHLPEALKDEKIIDVLSTKGGQLQFSKGIMRGLFDKINPQNYTAAEKQQTGEMLYQVVKQMSVKKKLHQPYSVLQIFEDVAKTKPDLGRYAQNMCAVAALAVQFGVDVDAAQFQKGVILGQILDKDVREGYEKALESDNETSMFKKALSKVNPLKLVPDQYAKRMVKYAMKKMAPKCAEMVKQQFSEASLNKVAKGYQH